MGRIRPLVFLLFILGCADPASTVTAPRGKSPSTPQAVESNADRDASLDQSFASEVEMNLPKTDVEWKKQLTPTQYEVTREKGTEPAFRNEYWDNKRAGIYQCVCCGKPLFSSEHKYESGTGWPSFWQPVDAENIASETDYVLFYPRTEVHCDHCVGASGPRLRGRTSADGAPLLHEFRRLELRRGSRRQALWLLWRQVAWRVN